MIQRKYSYTGIDGNHWPDAESGDDLYYSIDFSCWLTAELDSLVSVSWAISAGITSSNDFVVDTEASIKIFSPTPGSFRAVCTIVSQDNGVEQSNTVPMILKVF